MKNWKASLVEFLSAVALALVIWALTPNVHAAGDMPPPSERSKPAPEVHVYPLIQAPGGLIPYPPAGYTWCDDTNTICTIRFEEYKLMDSFAVIGRKCVGTLDVLPPTKKPDAKEILKSRPLGPGGVS